MPRLMSFTFGVLSGFTLIVHVASLNMAVIGAGPSGLASLKNIVDQKHKVDVFEQGESIGGIWWYTDETGNDKYGNPIYSPMYQGLRTRAPCHAMEFPKFHYPDNTPSFPSQKDVLDYLKSYVAEYELEQYIQFNHKVEKVIPIHNKWVITVKNLVKGNESVTSVYDAVFVCSGTYSSPRKLKIKGKFDGEIFHSHDYRSAANYKDKKVLVIGAGPSATDIAQQLTKYAKQVTLSQRKRPNETAEQRQRRQELFGEKIVLKDDVAELVSTGVIYEDGKQQDFDVIIYAIGYDFTYPFLSEKVGIKYDNNHVRPLYKQILNIEHPTMAFIGVPLVFATNQMYDLQARFALKFISEEKPMPSKKEMEDDLAAETKKLRENNIPAEKTHILNKSNHKNYYNELADTAEIENVADVYSDILIDAYNLIQENPNDFRSNRYTLSPNKETFTRTEIKENNALPAHKKRKRSFMSTIKSVLCPGKKSKTK